MLVEAITTFKRSQRLQSLLHSRDNPNLTDVLVDKREEPQYPISLDERGIGVTHIRSQQKNKIINRRVVPERGIEPPTFSLRVNCSTD